MRDFGDFRVFLGVLRCFGAFCLLDCGVWFWGDLGIVGFGFGVLSDSFSCGLRWCFNFVWVCVVCGLFCWFLHCLCAGFSVVWDLCYCGFRFLGSFWFRFERGLFAGCWFACVSLGGLDLVLCLWLCWVLFAWFR